MRDSVVLSRIFAFTLVVLSGAFPAQFAVAADKPGVELGGLVFGDLYYVPSHHLPEGDDATGLVMRRAYLTLNAKFGAGWFGRVRLETNQAGEFETYDFDTDFKDLYLGRDFGKQRVIAGLTSTPTYDLIEKIWGARYLMRTALDLQGIASRDTGLYAAGPLGSSSRWSYRAMVASAADFAKDSNDDERVLMAVSYLPAPGWTLDFYADYQWRDDPDDWWLLQAFAAYQTDNIRWGVQYSYQDRGADSPLDVASAFLVVGAGEKRNWIARVDRLFEPSPRRNSIDYLPFDPTASATLLLGGLEFQTNEHFAVTPNVVIIHYDHNDQGQRPETDVHLRLTLFVNFE
jgi:hypothetical protein